MADPSFSWIYLIIFLAIPLARIIPRVLTKKRTGNKISGMIHEKQSQSDVSEITPKPRIEYSKPQTKNMLVLDALNRGSKTFENIQKNTGLNNKELDAILEDLENNGILKVEQKQGFFGPKIELYTTDKGFKEYYS
jgi:predicted transcriptional regulator